MENKFSLLIYSGAAFFLTSIAGQAFTAYQVSKMDDVVREQLEGKLSATAQEVIALREDVKTTRAQMLTQEQLKAQTDTMLRGLSSESEERVRAYMRETGAKIEEMSTRFTGIEIEIKKGRTRRGASTPNTPPPPPPPSSWKGVKKEDYRICEAYPDRCDTLPFSWSAPYMVKGNPLAEFSKDNFWTDESTLKLNLAYRVDAITYRGEGLVKNQGVYIQAGYFDASGKFVMLAEDKLMVGDPSLDPQLFYAPTLPLAPPSVLRMFEPSILMGVNYVADGFGVSLGGSVLNFNEARYRLGGNVTLKGDGWIGAGVMASYHPRFFGKNLNVAPALGVMWDKNLSASLSAGLFFQVW